jgi:hypothetical protein
METGSLRDPGCPPSTFLSVDDGRPRIYSSGTSYGHVVNVCYIDGGHS